MPFDNPTPIVVHPTVQLLRDGIRRIKRRWCKGGAVSDRRDRDGHFGFCMIGSISYDDNGHALFRGMNGRRYEDAFEYMAKAVQLLTLNRFDHPVGYNDYDDRTKEDVVLAMELATELAERDLIK